MLSFKIPSEETLALRLSEGKKSAQRDFYTRFAPFLMALCSRYVTNSEDAKDVLQEAMIKIFIHAAHFKHQGNGSLRAWASRIVTNEALLYLRQQKRLLFAEMQDVEDDSDEPLEADDISSETLQRMIQSLPDGYRVVFCLYVFEDMSHQEIAKQLGISAATSASQLMRARRRLQHIINEYRKKGGSL